MRYTPDHIAVLGRDEIFVFGSNLAGKHGRGAARDAWHRFGAEWGVGQGHTGECYAIATKDRNLRVLPLSRIETQVHRFLVFAEAKPYWTFLVTPIGCGLAGYSPKDIAPMFVNNLKNVVLPKSFYDATRTSTPEP